jgi:hypothetical protein
MDRQGRVDAVYKSVKSIEDQDAFQHVIENVDDNFVLADLRNRFWTEGSGKPKPWQVVEINRQLTLRKESPKDEKDGHRDVRIAKITAVQGIAVAAIMAVAGVLGAMIQRYSSPNAVAPAQHWLRFNAVTLEGAPQARFRITALVDGVPYSYPGHAVWATAPGITSPLVFPLPAGRTQHEVGFQLFYQIGNGVIQQAQQPAVPINAVPYEGEAALRDLIDGSRQSVAARVRYEIRTSR